jgi:lauroyl/myristoyl acyltransferase
VTPAQRAAFEAYRLAARAAVMLPERAAGPVASAAGRILAEALRGRRTMVARHLQRVHGGSLDRRQLDRAVAGAFDSYARYWLEAFRAPSLSKADLDARLTVDGFDRVEAALAVGSGAILALPHLGSWDLAGAWVTGRGMRLTVVVEQLEPPELFEWFVGQRREMGMSIVPLGSGAATAVMRALQANEIVALLCDRDIGGGGIAVEFFGEVTTLPGGPATLALRTGAPILPAGVYAVSSTRHVAEVRRALPTERTGRLRDDVARVTQLLARDLEAIIRKAPEQWHLFQPNWPSDRL